MVFTLTPHDTQAFNVVVIGTLLVCYLDVRVLLDPGASYSFVSPLFALMMER